MKAQKTAGATSAKRRPLSGAALKAANEKQNRFDRELAHRFDPKAWQNRFRQTSEVLEVFERFGPPGRRFFILIDRRRTEIGLPAALRWIVRTYVPRAFQGDLLALMGVEYRETKTEGGEGRL